MDEANPYKSPKTESGPAPRPDVDPFYRLQRFLLVIVPAIVGAIAGYLAMAFLAFATPSKEVGAGIGGVCGLILGLTIRLATRRR